jgi:ATP-dependent DNA helicase RecG
MPSDTHVRYIKGVGQAREKAFSKLGVHTLLDLVSYFPRAYEDRTAFCEIGDLKIGQTVCVRAMAAESPRLSHIRKGLDLLKFRAVDNTGTLDITFFNQSFLKNKIAEGEVYIFYGKVTGTYHKPAMTNPIFEVETSSGNQVGRIMPIYALTAGISQKILQNAVRHSLDKCGDILPDVLTESVIRRFELCRARFAFENIHFPSDLISLELARKRLIFEELFVLCAAMKQLRLRRIEKVGKSLENQDLSDFFNALSFEPTGAQKRAIAEAARDMSLAKPMSRLVQGDVGSGKTLVAAACCFITWRSGCQSAFMAPTEILAKQHYKTLSTLLVPLGVNVGLLLGSMTAKNKREVNAALENGQIDIIVGTHALISESVRFNNLALVITDEQHRFGVNQRSMLSEKGNSPHVLVMSATPIPRTLALIIYGDLDVSIIDEMPPGRREIETYVVQERHRKRAYGFIEKLVSEGRQVYVICPKVEETEENFDTHTELKSAELHYEVLKNEIFPHLRVRLVHGKMHVKEKDAAFSEFTQGQADILVATTVVEVGVDVANAALMIVENAERFGLSQLHQLRGRVGRGEHKSYCVLFQGTDNETSRERLEIMTKTNDGFKIAEEDLKMRGPGDFFGSRQHGLPVMKIANFAEDISILNYAQNAAEEIVNADPELESPENKRLKKQIKRMFEINSDKLN